MAYSNKVLDHYENPRNVGKLDDKDDNVGTGMVGAPACGDVMRLQIKVNAAGVIEDAKFKTYGCGSAIASSSLATEWLKGKTVDEALAIYNQLAEGQKADRDLRVNIAQVYRYWQNYPVALASSPSSWAMTPRPGTCGSGSSTRPPARQRSNPTRICSCASILGTPRRSRTCGPCPGLPG